MSKMSIAPLHCGPLFSMVSLNVLVDKSANEQVQITPRTKDVMMEPKSRLGTANHKKCWTNSDRVGALTSHQIFIKTQNAFCSRKKRNPVKCGLTSKLILGTTRLLQSSAEL